MDRTEPAGDNRGEIMLRLEWDESKNVRNLAKHGVSFQLAAEVFNDPLSITVEDQLLDGEERYRTLGCVRRLILILVAHTNRFEEGDEVIRIISARKATPGERRSYEEAQRKRTT